MSKINYLIKYWFSKEKGIVYLLYVFFSLMVIAPLLRPGHIFALDITTIPRFLLPLTISYGWLWSMVLWLINFIFPAAVIQKFIFFIILFLSGLGMHRLVGGLKSNWSKYFAGLLYMFNPFVYSRFLYGQLRPLLAYAFFPWLVFSIFKFIRQPRWQDAVRVALWFVVIGVINPHTLLISFIFLLIVFVFRVLWSIRNPKILLSLLRGAIIIAVIFVILSSYWLIPFLTNSSKEARELGFFDQRDILGFQTTRDSELGVWWNTAAMYGFWGDREGRYILLKEFTSYWFWLYLLILLLVLWGIISSVNLIKRGIWRMGQLFLRQIKNFNMAAKYQFFRHYLNGIEPWLILSLVANGIVALILAVGIAHPWAASISWWLYDNFSFYRGFREPQKWVMILVFVYAYLAALGVDNLLPIFENWLKKIRLHFFSIILPGLLILIPLAYSPGMFWGFQRQICLSNYPASWYELNEFMNKNVGDSRVLFFPWHMYMSFSFSCNQVVANPADLFFDKQVIVGDNIEMGNIFSHSTRKESRIVEKYLGQKPELIDHSVFAKDLRNINVKYIILAKEVDWQNYNWLEEFDDLEVVRDNKHFKVYLNVLLK